nr:helix-turn-helix domain-containing protein [Pseudomonas sp.]
MSDSSTSSGTVARVAKLLSVLAEAEGHSALSEIAQRMGLPASTTHRLLNLLVEQGFVERESSTKSYRVGLELFRIGSLVASKMTLPDVAGKFMQDIVDACDETCMLSLHDASSHSFMIGKVIYGSHPLRYKVDLYQRSSLVWGAPGRGILAFLPEDVISEAIAQE